MPVDRSLRIYTEMRITRPPNTMRLIRTKFDFDTLRNLIYPPNVKLLCNGAS